MRCGGSGPSMQKGLRLISADGHSRNRDNSAPGERLCGWVRGGSFCASERRQGVGGGYKEGALLGRFNHGAW